MGMVVSVATRWATAGFLILILAGCVVYKGHSKPIRYNPDHGYIVELTTSEMGDGQDWAYVFETYEDALIALSILEDAADSGVKPRMSSVDKAITKAISGSMKIIDEKRPTGSIVTGPVEQEDTASGPAETTGEPEDTVSGPESTAGEPEDTTSWAEVETIEAPGSDAPPPSDTPPPDEVPDLRALGLIEDAMAPSLPAVEPEN